MDFETRILPFQSLSYTIRCWIEINTTGEKLEPVYLTLALAAAGFAALTDVPNLAPFIVSLVSFVFAATALGVTGELQFKQKWAGLAVLSSALAVSARRPRDAIPCVTRKDEPCPAISPLLHAAPASCTLAGGPSRPARRSLRAS